MSFDISSSFHLTRESSFATLCFLTHSQDFSPIRQLQSASSTISPKVLFSPRFPRTLGLHAAPTSESFEIENHSPESLPNIMHLLNDCSMDYISEHSGLVLRQEGRESRSEGEAYVMRQLQIMDDNMKRLKRVIESTGEKTVKLGETTHCQYPTTIEAKSTQSQSFHKSIHNCQDAISEFALQESLLLNTSETSSRMLMRRKMNTSSAKSKNAQSA